MKSKLTVHINDASVFEGEVDALFDILTAAVLGARMLNDSHIEANTKEILLAMGRFL